MKTPYTYKKNLNNGIISKYMMFACIYSVDMRARNCWRRIHQRVSTYGDIGYQSYYQKRGQRYLDRREQLMRRLPSEEIKQEYYRYEKARPYSGLKSLVSAQFVTRVAKSFEKGMCQYGEPCNERMRRAC